MAPAMHGSRETGLHGSRDADHETRYRGGAAAVAHARRRGGGGVGRGAWDVALEETMVAAALVAELGQLRAKISALDVSV